MDTTGAMPLKKQKQLRLSLRVKKPVRIATMTFFTIYKVDITKLYPVKDVMARQKNTLIQGENGSPKSQHQEISV